METPKKITPDSLKDTIVQIHFVPNCPSELVLGLFYSKFKENFDFIGGEIVRREGNQLALEEMLRGHFVDKNKEVKINVLPDHITFNSISNYPGWDSYFSIIENILNGLRESDLVNSINRIGIRYISQFDNIEIFERLKLDISFPLNNELFHSQFKTQFVIDDFNVILNILNKVKPVNFEGFASAIDIDVNQVFSSPIDVEKCLNEIDKGHKHQKRIFFSLLKEEFLSSLNPEYK